ncbi:TetR/AcrR family transcriptional regulator [Streptomyces sp. NPDC048718]|uniref:TetR/AcrR family transcriptional regulator n=1 Tax=Streptomyces sp. NPDC048718 TaxID=3365587 RepID=UPI0037238B40
MTTDETRRKLLEGALKVLVEQGIAKTSARAVAAAAGVNQALVFYHFGSMDELLAAACRFGSEQRVARYREQMGEVASLSELLALGRALHEQEREAGHVAVLGQLLAGAQTHPKLGPATAAGLDLWIEEIETVLRRLLAGGPLDGAVDPAGLARTVAASFVGMELYEAVDPAGADAALDALEQLAGLLAALEELSPVARGAVRYTLRRKGLVSRQAPGRPPSVHAGLADPGLGVGPGSGPTQPDPA